MSNKFKELMSHFSKLPGIGPRHAARLVLNMLNWPPSQLIEFGQAIGELKTGIRFCKECFNMSDEEICSICIDPKRNIFRIAVVEQLTDLMAFEKASIYNGVYHVLGGSINPNHSNPYQIRTNELRERIERLKQTDAHIEIILATNANTYGETTALYLEEELRPLNIMVTRLARGLSAGSFVEYADAITLGNALKHRK